jgi:hypothetical protein
LGYKEKGMNKYYKWITIAGLAIAAIAIPITAPKAPKEKVELYRVTVDHAHFISKKRFRFEMVPTIENIVEDEKAKIIMTTPDGDYAYLEEWDEDEESFKYIVKKIVRRRRVEDE